MLKFWAWDFRTGEEISSNMITLSGDGKVFTRTKLAGGGFSGWEETNIPVEIQWSNGWNERRNWKDGDHIPENRKNMWR